ncbi:hypothetical protein BLOT_011974 [Blomia tropicalis]|nr:hypothetical protein BLOT_011974 [Blomia tropicalis]
MGSSNDGIYMSDGARCGVDFEFIFRPNCSQNNNCSTDMDPDLCDECTFPYYHVVFVDLE